MQRLVVLEAFDDDPVPEIAPAGPSAEWTAGFAAGRENALSENDRDIATRRDAAIQAILDMQFTYAEARREILIGLEPVFANLVSVVVPALVRASIAPLVMENLLAAAAVDSAAPCKLVVSSDIFPSIEQVLEPSVPLPVRLTMDPELAPGRVLLTHGATETSLDSTALVDRLCEILSAVSEMIPERTKHG